MKADELLIEDHGVIRGLLHQLEQSRSEHAAERSELLDRLLSVLDVHVQIENDLFYPAIRDVSPLYAIAHAEHRQIDDQLAVVFRTDPTSEDFHTEVKMLAATVEHHASEEEQEMFPQAKALGETELETLGQAMRQRQQHLRTSAVSQTRLRIKRETLRRL
ncbi:Hemerythrin HHE cation binding domain-containing protein [Modestobacter sp. DSM 44400]|uniref:hemerythrin domain-containing protein n=1 Tax=Modestobacter sp. DSM 44400 TaxID=1550230 RepID=UPI000896E125|nr:hemerythrin domain-containing protein [Modestobacter sp. DSM 44400]SDY25772.1 Hemerythrin HHE cation binding domain-containing protein [Modestobacter sp. DSM 44400]